MLFYQFFSYTVKDEIDVNTEAPSIVNIEYKEPDTTAIDANYRDPFTGNLQGSVKTNTGEVDKSPTNDKINTEVIPREQVQINYKGIVTDLTNKSKVFMVIINHKTFLMQQGDKENEVELISGTNESIVIKHKGTKKTILLIE
jgi:hypothetical protein